MIKNSISTLLQKILVQSNNSLNIYKGIRDAVSSNKETVIVTVENEDNPEETTTIQVPSFGYLNNTINRLENSIKTLSNVNDGAGSTIRLSDGTYRKIMTAKIPSEAPTITTADGVTEFKFKSNWFFEDMINPLLYVTYDLTGQVPVSTNKVHVQRYILSCINPTQIAWFDNLKSRADINYKEFLYGLIQNKVTYVLDEETKDLPIRSKRFIGNFDVVNINNVTVSEIVNNVTTTKTVREYTLNKLTYTDTITGFEDTKFLSVGDTIEVNKYPISTRYQVSAIDNSRNVVQLNLIEGFEIIFKGTDVLRFSSELNDEIKAEIPVGFDERCVCFIKPIDPDSNIPAVNWSPGIAFYTNELTYTDDSGQQRDLAYFYNRYVVDIGKILLSYSDDFYPSIRDGIIPEVPTLNTDDFKVVQINKQVTDTDATEKINKLVSEKLQLSQSIDNETASISALQTKIKTTNYLSVRDRLNDENELENLINTRDTNTVAYSSVVNQIQAIYSSDTVNKLPKYHIRGFWEIPTENVGNSGTQSIIKFKYRYRYLSENGSANNTEEFKISGTENTSKAIFSNWLLGETQLRNRVQNSTTGVWYWEDIDNSKLESVDINQLDIPITSGEKVEIQVKSVCEAGFPANPLESNWSESVIISFPANLVKEGIDGIVNQNKQDLAKVSLQKELTAIGVKSHLTDSFVANNTYYAHDAEHITSGFLTAEQTPITLYDKLHDLQSQVTILIEQINQAQGQIKVELVDENGALTELIEGGTTIVNAGYYKEWVNEHITQGKHIADNGVTVYDKAGAIMTKTYNIKITNTNQSGLMLLSKLPGSRISMVPNTVKSARGLTYDESDTRYLNENFSFRYDLYDNIVSELEYDNEYYQNIGRYDLVPINLQGSTLIDFQLASSNMYQSAQARGQYIYSRFRDVSDTFNLYANKGKKDKLVNGVYQKFDSVGIYNETSNMMFSELFGCDRTAIVAKAGNNYYTLKGASKLNINIENTNGFSFSFDEYLAGYTYEDSDGGDYMSESYVRYNSLAGSNLDRGSFPYPEYYFNYASADGNHPVNDNYDYGNDNLKCVNYVLYRIPRTYQRAKSGVSTSIKGGKIKVRLNNINQSASDLEKYLKRVQTVQSNVTTKQFNIEPRIQTSYGFGDLDYRKDIFGSESETDDHQYLTTHKIGFLPEDKFIQNTANNSDMGFNGCNSYLFLSPIEHENIQVNGDSRSSYIDIQYGDQNSLYVPLVYQSRMTTYPITKARTSPENKYETEGVIFGNSSYTEFSKTVQNTYFSNIIGIDIWVDKNLPKQYDIIVYSKYSRTTADITNNKSQALVDAIKDASGNNQTLARNSTKSSMS